METSTDLQILKLQWGENLKSSIFKLVILTIVFIIGLILTFTYSNLEEIIKNWSRYRCNPAFMPLAGMAGYDASENFQFCLNSIFGDKARELFAPIFAVIANFVQILKLVVDASLGLRQMFSRFFLGMNNYIRNVRDRIQALMFQVRLSFLKLQNLMGRVYATMFSVVFMGMSAVTAGLNLSENSLVKFVLDFCFAPDTPVLLKSGESKAIQDIQIGDELSGGRVTSTFKLKGTNTPMVRIQGATMSAEHMVQGPNGWCLAKDHPNARPNPNIPLLICLNTDTHRFQLANGLTVCDYDETEEAHVVGTAQGLAEKALNAGISGNPVQKYGLGFSRFALVQLQTQTWIPAHEVKLGMYLVGGNEVLGIVEEACDDIYVWNRIPMSGAQLVEDKGIWKRVAHISEQTAVSRTLIQFITRNVGPFTIRASENQEPVWVRDYREAPIPEMETCYRQEVKTKID